MTRVEIIFENIEKARAFLTWLCESGEQHYFEETTDNAVRHFHYNWDHLIAVTEGQRNEIDNS